MENLPHRWKFRTGHLDLRDSLASRPTPGRGKLPRNSFAPVDGAQESIRGGIPRVRRSILSRKPGTGTQGAVRWAVMGAAGNYRDGAVKLLECSGGRDWSWLVGEKHADIAYLWEVGKQGAGGPSPLLPWERGFIHGVFT